LCSRVFSLEMICEPSHLKRLNSRESLEDAVRRDTADGDASAPAAGCETVGAKDDIYFPAFERGTRHCYLQRSPLLFSCVGEVSGLVRLCACRDYVRGQTALCSRCL